MASLTVRVLALTLAAGTPALAAPDAPRTAPLSYVQLADMALAAPVVLAADITQSIPLKGEAAAGVAPGRQRFYIEAAVRALISGRAELPPTISYLVDLPIDPAVRKPKLKGLAVLLLAAPTAKPGMVRLIGPDAQLPRTPANEARLRAILTASVAPDAPPAITGIARAFHVPGSIPGESETQIFLRTADARPISLSILRRPGEKPRWAVALSEMVDNSAAPPKPDSLLWYRLACGLPAALPAAAVADLSPADADAARADYALVVEGLGPCRTQG